MTESPSIPSSGEQFDNDVERHKSAVLTAAREEAEASRLAATSFSDAWRAAASSNGAQDVWVALNPHPVGRSVAVELSDHVHFNQDLWNSDTWRFTRVDENLENPVSIDLPTAAHEAGLTPEKLQAALPALHASAQAAAPHLVEQARAHNRVGLAANDLERAATQAATPEPALEPAPDYDITPERVVTDWIQSTTLVSAYLESGRPDLAREWIEKLDENLQTFEDGGGMGDDNSVIYHDAIARAAIPYGQPPITVEEVARQLGNLGITVPPLDLQHLPDTTDVSPLGRDYITNLLDETTPDPTLRDVAAARLSVRRAMVDITENTSSAQEHLSTANHSLSSAIETMRPDTQADARQHAASAQELMRQASTKLDAVTETAAKVDTEVTIYTTPDCVGCAATKRALDKVSVEYEEIDLAKNPHLLKAFKQQGLAQAPIVETKNGDRWAGFNPTKLKEHGLDYRSRQQRGSGPDTGQEHGR